MRGCFVEGDISDVALVVARVDDDRDDPGRPEPRLHRRIGRRPLPADRLPVVLRPGASGRAPVVRRQEAVVRPAQLWTPAVHALLRHPEAVGCTGAPGVRRGPQGYGNQVLSFVDGESVHLHAWSDYGIHALGALLRQLHDAAETFSASDDMIWQPWFTRQTGPGTIIDSTSH
jgi:hypothetical protein